MFWEQLRIAWYQMMNCMETIPIGWYILLSLSGYRSPSTGSNLFQTIDGDSATSSSSLTPARDGVH